MQARCIAGCKFLSCLETCNLCNLVHACVQGSGGAGLLQNAGLTVTLFLVICAFLAAAQLGGESVS